MYNFVVSLGVTGKQRILASVQYTDAEQQDLDHIVAALKRAVVSVIHHDAHKDPKVAIDHIHGDITLPDGRGTWEAVLSLVSTPALSSDFTVRWPKCDKRSALKIEGALLKLMENLNASY